MISGTVKATSVYICWVINKNFFFQQSNSAVMSTKAAVHSPESSSRSVVENPADSAQLAPIKGPLPMHCRAPGEKYKDSFNCSTGHRRPVQVTI